MSVFINWCICTVHALFLCTLRVPNALLWVSCRPHPALVTEILKIWHYFSDRSSCDWVLKAVKDGAARRGWTGDWTRLWRWEFIKNMKNPWRFIDQRFGCSLEVEFFFSRLSFEGFHCHSPVAPMAGGWIPTGIAGMAPVTTLPNRQRDRPPTILAVSTAWPAKISSIWVHQNESWKSWFILGKWSLGLWPNNSGWWNVILYPSISSLGQCLLATGRFRHLRQPAARSHCPKPVLRRWGA